MDMTGEFRIPAPRRKVWEALNDPEILKQSIPGCEEIEKISPTKLAAKVTAKGGATVRLADDGDGTRLTYVVEAHVGGKLAQIGSRLIDATARKMAEDFFTRFSSIVGGVPAAAAAEPEVALETAAQRPSPPPAAAPPAGLRLPPALWVAGLAVFAAILLYFVTRGGGH